MTDTREPLGPFGEDADRCLSVANDLANALIDLSTKKLKGEEYGGHILTTAIALVIMHSAEAHDRGVAWFGSLIGLSSEMISRSVQTGRTKL